MNFLRLIKKLGGVSPAEDEMRFLESHGFTHGDNFYCYSPYAIDASWPFLISIGDNVTISSDVKILAHDASTNLTGARTKVGIVSIGSNVFVGAGSTILCNTRIGDNVVIGARSLVSKDVPSNCVVAGNPARIICSFEEYKAKHMEARNSGEHPIFNKHEWNEWINAGKDDWNEMRRALADTFGYL